ncbi:MAG: DUF1015 domain-containing protein [Candidatus Zixiibacteriota bacterium]|nr:MAG: DUF1015 domain-containing protein [candidate division Zixibacteria bacterium]
MSIVRPFRGLRPRPEYAATVASPPYDVLSSDEARAMVKNNPNSFLRINKPEVDFESGVSLYSDEIYQRGKQNLQRLTDEGIMCRDEKQCFYLYRLTWMNQSQTGLVALTSCEEYNQGKIKKHEHTRPDKVNDRANHIQEVAAQVGPVFSIFRDNPYIQALFAGIVESPPDYDFTSEDDVRHEMWVVDNADIIDNLVTTFGKLDALYIADGHHRSAAASEVARRMKEQNPNHTGDEQYNFFLNVIFPDSELRILPYNRVVKGLNGMTTDELLTKLKDAFEVTPQPKAVDPEKPYHFGVLCQDKWYCLTAKEGTFDTSNPADSIDSAVLTANLLSPVLGIEDIRTDKNIDFVGGIRGVQELERLVKSGDFDIAFSLYPVTVSQLLAVADAGEVMPPKSTWFEPKLRSGMVINLLDK